MLYIDLGVKNIATVGGAFLAWINEIQLTEKVQGSRVEHGETLFIHKYNFKWKKKKKILFSLYSVGCDDRKLGEPWPFFGLKTNLACKHKLRLIQFQ